MSQLKFEKVGHSVYVLDGEACLGRLKKRYDDKVYFEPFHDAVFSGAMLIEIVDTICEGVV
jgi:hypothetical protein